MPSTLRTRTRCGLFIACCAKKDSFSAAPAESTSPPRYVLPWSSVGDTPLSQSCAMAVQSISRDYLTASGWSRRDLHRMRATRSRAHRSHLTKFSSLKTRLHVEVVSGIGNSYDPGEG